MQYPQKMKSVRLLTVSLLLLSSSAFAQGVAINVDDSAPDASSILDVKSDSQGVLIPRMTETNRNNISTPANGLLIYQTDNTPGFYYNAGTSGSPSWTQLGGNSGGSAPTLSFSNFSGSVAVFPPMFTETTVTSVSTSVSAGDNLKVDYSLENEFTVTANWGITTEFRLYRDGTLINSKMYSFNGASAGTQRIPVAGTFVDTAPSTTTATYEVRVIITTATNITSVTSANRNMNIITFAP